MKLLKASAPLIALMTFALLAWLLGPTLAYRAAAVDKLPGDTARSEVAQLSKNDTLSPLFRAVARAVKPAVVEVRVVKMVREPDMEDFLRRFFDENSPGGKRPDVRGRIQPRPVHGLGSGVIVDANNGYILTNYHVVGGADSVEVVLADNRKFANEWIRVDPQTDLAVIKIKPDNLTAAPLGDSDRMETGDWVLAIGAPSGLSATVTAGIISATGRSTGDSSVAASYQDFLQIDAAINRGNSGGPLVNMRAEVIGLNNLIISSGGGNEGIGLAIPSAMARQVMQQLITQGKVTRGFLGVAYQDVDDALARSFKLPDTRGALVTKVVDNSPAAKAGVQVGDFIIAVDAKPIVNGNQLRNTIAALGPGKTAKIDILREGEKKQFEIALTEQPKQLAATTGPEDDEPAATQPRKSFRRFGMEVANLGEDLAVKFGYRKITKGVVVTDVRLGSSAYEQGLREGMLITQVAAKEVHSVEELTAELDKAKEGARLLITTPQGTQRFVFLAPDKQ